MNLMKLLAATMFPALLAPALSAGELVVVVNGASDGKGEIGCAVYRSAEGFPMNRAKAVARVWVKAGSPVECRFADLPPGELAVAVSHDLNGNRETDKNLFGIPKEPWGVSNNVRPGMRAPRFEEARVQMPASGELRIEVQVAK